MPLMRSAARSSSPKAWRARANTESAPGSLCKSCCATRLIMSGARSATRANCVPKPAAARPITDITSNMLSTAAAARLRTTCVNHPFNGATNTARIRPAVTGIKKLRPHHSATITARAASTRSAEPEVGITGPVSGVGAVAISRSRLEGMFMVGWVRRGRACHRQSAPLSVLDSGALKREAVCAARTWPAGDDQTRSLCAVSQVSSAAVSHFLICCSASPLATP